MKVDVLPVEKNWKGGNAFRFYVNLPGVISGDEFLLVKWNAT